MGITSTPSRSLLLENSPASKVGVERLHCNDRNIHRLLRDWQLKKLLWNFILFYFILFYFILFFCFLGLHSQHMEVPSLGVELEPQLPAYVTATATRDPNCVCDLHHSSRQCRIPDTLSKSRDRTHILMDNTSRIHFHCATQERLLWNGSRFPFLFVKDHEFL